VHLDGTEPVTSERLLVATGRFADLKGLGASAAGIDENKRFITWTIICAPPTGCGQSVT
jgi:pyruvate/2-oxoglutarate dehydrogenase complex dihydrolipoamide dehydrogenase (E3) component